ncbi:MAG: PQQ-binding-like beta-propeller repeat protein [Vicinamibacterales bacterium]
MLVVVTVLVAIAEAAIPFAKLDTRWSVTLAAPPSAGTAFDATTAYVPTRGGELVAIDLDRGAIRWRASLTTTLTPATGDGLVFTAAGDLIEARESTAGEIKWQTTLAGDVATPLYWERGWLIASSLNGELVALRSSDGTKVWSQPIGAALAVPPVLAFDRLCLALTNGRLLAIELATGATVWSRSIPGRISGLLSLPDQLVFGTTENTVQSAHVKNGRERWHRRVGGDVVGIPFADARRIYFVSRDNMVRAVDRKSGNLRWTATLESRPAGGPFMASEVVMVPLVSESIEGFDPASGKKVVTLEAAGETAAQPHVRDQARTSGARLITVSRDGQLQGFGLRFEPPPSRLRTGLGAPALP